jgi:Spy/CpxP family protein refolding chaperone
MKLQHEGDKKLLEVLTPEQRKQFTEMQGKKLELKLFSA